MRYQDFRMWMAAWWAGIFGQTRLSRVGEGKSTTDIVRMVDPDGEGSEEVIELVRLEQFGDVVIPPPETQCAMWRKGDGGFAMSLAVPDLRPKDCKPGDRALYCSAPGTVLKLHGASSATPSAIELKRQDGSSVVLTAAGDVVLTDKSGHTATLRNGVLTVETDVVVDTIYAEHYAGRGSTPTVTAGAGVGTGSAAVQNGGSDTAFVLVLVVKSGSPGVLATVRFAKEYDRTPQGIPAPGALSATAATPPAAGSFFVASVAADQFQVATLATLPDGTYYLSFVVVR